jgi:hypothetical protein
MGEWDRPDGSRRPSRVLRSSVGRLSAGRPHLHSPPGRPTDAHPGRLSRTGPTRTAPSRPPSKRNLGSRTSPGCELGSREPSCGNASVSRLPPSWSLRPPLSSPGSECPHRHLGGFGSARAGPLLDEPVRGAWDADCDLGGHRCRHPLQRTPLRLLVRNAASVLRSPEVCGGPAMGVGRQLNVLLPSRPPCRGPRQLIGHGLNLPDPRTNTGRIPPTGTRPTIRPGAPTADGLLVGTRAPPIGRNRWSEPHVGSHGARARGDPRKATTP